MATGSTTEVQNRATSASLPAIGSSVLAVIWGVYTIFFLYEFFSGR